MPQFLVISTSLDPHSRSRLLARHAHGLLESAETNVTWLDTQDLQLPVCDGRSAWEHPATERLKTAIDEADGILIAFGVYNFAASAITKTILELGGKAFEAKVVGFSCASGGERSYMAVMGLANSLMLDFRAVIVPRFVYAAGDAFNGTDITDVGVQDRIGALVADLRRMTTALRGQPALLD